MGGLTYRDAGVDIDKKEQVLKRIGPLVKATYSARVLHEHGAFGGLFDGRFDELDDPILVATNDGVGTKVRLGIRTGRTRLLGHDIVNHCVDDILVQGAEPLFFLDYFASSILDPAQFEELVTGLAEACKAVGAALLGGETAEMPGVYAKGEGDIVGFLVGLVDRSRLWPRDVADGDALVGIRSDGLHTNGYSLVNRILDEQMPDLDADPGGLGESLADALCRPHRSYLDAIRRLREEVRIHALAHITGGGLEGNLPRVLPAGLGAVVDRATWTPNPVFDWLRKAGGIEREEAYRVFNMGCGLVVTLPAADAERAVEVLEAGGDDAWVMGRIEKREGVRLEG